MADDVVLRPVKVTSPQGLHVRPASRIVQVAQQFACQIELVKGTERANAKSIMDLMTLAAEHGTELIVEARGTDAAAAADALEHLFANVLGDLPLDPENAAS